MRDERNDNAGTIKIGLKWIFSKVALITDIIKNWDKTIASDEELKKNVEEHL